MSNKARSVPSDSGTGFQPVNPWKAADLGARRRNLPHLETTLATYLVTFRCRNEITLPGPAKDIVLSALRYWDGRRIELDMTAVMPEHVHAIFRVIDDSELSAILHSIKSYFANAINRLIGASGSLWLDESFDHIIRHEEEWKEKIAYVRNNPVKWGLASNWTDYPWIWPKESY
jgi:REP element-mobilizing transposase RayT